MTSIRAAGADPTLRAFALLAIAAVIFVTLALYAGVTLNAGTAFGVFQNFASVGLVALGLGLTVLIGEFDISVAGMFTLGGCIAVLAGSQEPVLGLIAAVAVGLAGGLIQATCVLRLGLSSVAVTLGGLLTYGGLSYVLTGNKSISSGHFDLAVAVNAPILGMFSARSLTCIALFAVAGAIVTYTTVGRDIIAVGSARQASRAAGVNTDRVVLGVFASSGALAALGGALLSFGLATASPAGLSDVTIPAIAAVILGGGSLSGGTGHPMGIAAGVLVLSLVRSGLTILGAPPPAHNIITGALLLAVAIVDGPDLTRRLFQLGRALERGQRT